MAKSNIVEFLVKGENGQVDTEATVTKFRESLDHYIKAETVDLDVVRGLMVQVLEKHGKLTATDLKVGVFMAAGADLSARASLDEKVSRVLKSDPMFVSAKGREGGVSLKKPEQTENNPEHTATENGRVRRGRNSQAA